MGIKDSDAFVLRTFKLAEADKIAVFLTQKFGVVRGVAKGARRLKSKFGAGLEPYTLVNLTYFEKEGRELVSIQQAEIIRSYFKLAHIDETVAALDYLSELALEFTPPNQPDEKFFRMVSACFSAIEQKPSLTFGVVRYFEIWTLKLTGFLPELKYCGVCGEDFANTQKEQTVHFTNDFSPRCAKCKAASDQKLSRTLYRLLRAVASTPPLTWGGRACDLDREDFSTLSAITRRLIERHLEKKTRQYLRVV